MGYGPTKSNNGAGNPGEQIVNFKLDDAKRIGIVVQTIENSRRDRRGSTLPRTSASGSGLRLATFVGGWPVGISKTVTYIDITTSVETATVTNHFYELAFKTGTRLCLVSAGLELVTVRC